MIEKANIITEYFFRITRHGFLLRDGKSFGNLRGYLLYKKRARLLRMKKFRSTVFS